MVYLEMFFFFKSTCVFYKETCESVWTPKASLYASLSNLRPDATTYECVWPGRRNPLIPLLCSPLRRECNINELLKLADW